MLIAKAGVYPSDGHWFEDIDKVVHKGRSWNEVFRKVVAYRKRNGFPVGNVSVEVLEQAEKRWPAGFWRKTVRGE